MLNERLYGRWDCDANVKKEVTRVEEGVVTDVKHLRNNPGGRREKLDSSLATPSKPLPTRPPA